MCLIMRLACRNDPGGVRHHGMRIVQSVCSGGGRGTTSSTRCPRHEGRFLQAPSKPPVLPADSLTTKARHGALCSPGCQHAGTGHGLLFLQWVPPEGAFCASFRLAPLEFAIASPCASLSDELRLHCRTSVRPCSRKYVSCRSSPGREDDRCVLPWH